VYSFRDLGNSSKGTTIVGTISGTNISFGTEVVFTSSAVNNVGTCFQTNAGQVVVAYRDNDATKGKVVGGTVSGTSITFGSIVIYRDAGAFYGGNVPVYDSVAGKNVIVYSTDAAAPAYQGQAIVQFLGNTNNTSFIGIADAAISSAASGNITVKGGIAASGLSSLTPNSDYYVQADGSITTSSAGVKIGKAMSATAINLEYSS
jgi:hypothetical protein